MKRFFDILLVAFFSPIWLPVYCLVFSLVIITSGFPVIYWSQRVGKDNVIFSMPKFRTMTLNTPVLATDLLMDPQQYLTNIGGFLRKTSLDEFPQLFSVLKGHMSLVGPRPALFNQDHLIEHRTNLGIHQLMPGITGWAQVNGRDELTDEEKAAYDLEYLNNKSLRFDIKIIFLTFLKVMKRDGVVH